MDGFMTPYNCVSCGKPKSRLDDELCEECRQEAQTGKMKDQLPTIKKPYVIRDAIATYGMAAQVDMAIEEMSELTKALCKERRTQLELGKHAEAHANVIEEIADVAIMLKQLLIMFDKDGEIQKEVDYKIDRLEQRLQKAHSTEERYTVQGVGHHRAAIISKITEQEDAE